MHESSPSGDPSVSTRYSALLDAEDVKPAPERKVRAMGAIGPCGWSR